jgi:hypothetical protein
MTAWQALTRVLERPNVRPVQLDLSPLLLHQRAVLARQEPFQALALPPATPAAPVCSIRTTLRMTTTHGATEYLVMSTQRHQASDLSTKVCSD